MTKAELIRKIVKRSGIPDSEAKIFFEIFLQKTSGMLRPGQAIKLKNFGFFQLRQAVFKTTSLRPSGKINQINTEVIVFTPFEGSEEEGLIFNIPAVVTERYNYIDSYFSLSIGKPVIPLQGIKDTDYFILPTGNEMKKLIESKVDKLLEDVEVIKDYVKDNEILFLKKTSFNEGQGESNWSIGKLDNGMLNVPFREESPEAGEDANYSNITWDFGEDLSRQIEEEAIIDASSEPAPVPVNDEPVSENPLDWDFDEQIITEETAETEQDEFDNNEETLAVDEITADNFQRVKAITAEFKFDDKKSDDNKADDNLAWDFGEDEIKTNDIDSFEEESVGTEKFENSEETEPESTIDTGSEAEQEIVESIPPEKEPENITPPVLERKEDIPPKSVIDKTKSREYGYSGKKSLLPFLIAMFTIIVVGVTVYLYINKISLYDVSTGKFLKSSSHTTASIIPTVIERNFDVPVTYPYPKNPNQSASVVDTDLSAALNVKSTVAAKPAATKKSNDVVPDVPKKTETASKNIKAQPPTNTSKTPAVKDVSQKVKNNIYQSGNNYIVQVSAWQSKTTADKEAAKFKAKGYVSYIERADLPGRGTWYRVKVGNFKSAAEAEKFSEKNK